MKWLELKIPPVAVCTVVGLAIWALASVPPYVEILDQNRRVVVLVLLFIGGYFGTAGVYAFRKAGTTVHPMDPEKASALVSVGVYGLSRNPMYLGLLFGLVAWALYLSSLWGIISCVFFVAYMNRFQIIPEERAMGELFGEEFDVYRKSVRRWL